MRTHSFVLAWLILLLAFGGKQAVAVCTGDCNLDGSITVDEIVLGVNIALGVTSLSGCPAFDADGNELLTVDELISAVDGALRGCALPTPTPVPVGPIMTSLSLANSEFVPVTSSAVDSDGREIYSRLFGTGFFIIVEAAPGPSGRFVGDIIFESEPRDASLRPDLQILVSRSLGDGSPIVCDNRGTLFAGVPAAASLTFDDSQLTTDIINEMSCRSKGGIRTFNGDACTIDEAGGGFGFGFVSPATKAQFCVEIARSWKFPVGDTVVAARVRDELGNPGEIREMIVRVAQ